MFELKIRREVHVFHTYINYIYKLHTPDNNENSDIVNYEFNIIVN